MKKIYSYLLIMFSMTAVMAQNFPADGIGYQAMLSKPSKVTYGTTLINVPVSNKDIVVRFELIRGGGVILTDEHALTTDMNGIFSCIIGTGNVSPAGQRLSDIKWGVDSVSVRVNIDQGEGFELFSEQKLWSTAYAQFANVAQYASLDNDTSAINEIQYLSLVGDSIKLTRGQGGISIKPLNDAIAKNTSDITGLKDSTVAYRTQLNSNTALINTNKTDIATNKMDITTNTSDIAGLKDSTAAHRIQLNSNTAAINTNKTDIANNNTNITTNTSNIATLSDSISVHRVDINANAGNIATNTAGISTLNDSISALRTELNSTNQKFVDLTTDQTIAGNKTFSSDLIVNGLTLGKGGSGIFSNTAMGDSALYSNTTGKDNTATGYRALNSNTTGSYNTANGNGALKRNTTGYYNTANGSGALQSNTTGNQNTAT
ncbi:MAG: hypothetical protein VXX46_02605, partial [Bacteroidota bacterium]|nr:hypothetical protein [Bacteroidota bacterium]